tara:strand:+ start:74 stop:778 length:705 start_codon:yes stop_codon:yes gene_type:complete
LIDLKKIILRDLYYRDDNFLASYGSNKILNVLKLIKIKFSKILVIQPSIGNKNIQIINKKYKSIYIEDLAKETNEYDLIISNFALDIELSVNPNIYLKILNNLLSKNGLVLMNLLNDSSFRTLEKTFIEIDEYLFSGAYQRFGPFINTQTLIKDLDTNKFNEIVATNDLLEVNYQSLKNLRYDLKSIGISNFNVPKPKFNRGLLLKIENIFKALEKNKKFMPIEFEITTISSWK